MDKNERCFRLYHSGEGLSWAEVAEKVGKPSANAARSAAWRWAEAHPDEAEEIETETEALDEVQEALEEIEDAALGDTVATDTSLQINGNELRAVVTSKQVRSYDDLIEAHQIDLDVWRQVGKVEHNTWPTPMKLKLENGTHVPAVVQLHQVAADFIKRVPEPILPIPKPVQVPIVHDPPPEPIEGAVRRSLVVCDTHFGFRRNAYTGKMEPFHDRLVLDLIIQLATALQVDDVDFLGDHNDATEFSTHYDGEPAFHKTTMPALVEENWWLQQLRAALPDARIKMFPGNHEARMQRALNSYLPVALDLRRVDQLEAPPAMSWANLLALDALQVDYTSDYPNEREWRNRNLCFLHSDIARSAPGSTAKKIMGRIKARVVFAHIHREESMTLVEEADGGKRRVIEATCPGCACRVDGQVPGSDGWNNWTQGVAVVDYEVGGSMASVQSIPIDKGHLIYNGNLFVARDRSEEIDAVIDAALAQMLNVS